MKAIRLLVFPVLIFISVVMLNGCSDDTPTNPGGGGTVNVSGKVNDQIGVGIPGVTVVIGGSTAVTSVDGSFTINGVTTPYNAYIVLASGTNPTGILYEGVTTSTPLFIGAGLSSIPNTARLTVSIPALVPGQEAKIFFADNGYFHYTNTITFPETSDSIRVNWTGSTNITGKIVVLVYSSSGGAITTYDKYGEKLNYVLNNGSTVTETFTNAELSTNPGETTVSGTVNLPAGYMTPKANLLLKFSPSGTMATGGRMGNEVLANAFSFVVPAGIPSAFTIGIDGQGSGPIGEFVQKIIIVQPGTSGNDVNLLAASNLSTPPNNATNIDTNTNFTFSTGSSGGIYQVTFNSPNRTFAVLTASTTGTVKIPSFSAYGLGLGSGLNYSWSVAKIPTITSVDGILNVPLFNNPGYSEITQSESRNFTSAP